MGLVESVAYNFWIEVLLGVRQREISTHYQEHFSYE